MAKPPVRIPSQSRPPERLPNNDGEPKVHSAVVTRYAALLSELYKDASEAERAKLNRADRRRLETRGRKRRSAKAQATNAAARRG